MKSFEHGHSGPKVIFIHGAMDRSASFIRTIRYIPQIHAIRYDRRGYGRSQSIPVARNITDCIDDVMSFVGEEQCFLVGHSMGGVIALAAAQMYPDSFRGIVAFEPPMPWMPWWEKHSEPNVRVGDDAHFAPQYFGAATTADAAEKFLRSILGSTAWEALPEKTRLARRMEGEALLSDLTILGRGIPLFNPEDISLPVSVGYGNETDEQHVHAVTYLCEKISNASLFCIDGAGHNAHNSHAQQFAQHVEAFIQSVAL